MCDIAGIKRKTNHSLRATGATEMFAADVPEKLIHSRTGHTLFGNMNHCSVNININMNQPALKSPVEEKFDALVSGASCSLLCHFVMVA